VAPPRAARGAEVLLSTSCVLPWHCDTDKEEQQAAMEVALPVLPGACHAHLLLLWAQDPLKPLHMVLQAWALTSREVQQSKAGAGCCIEDLKEVMP